MSEGLRIHPGRIREQIQRLRAWRGGWNEGIERARRTSRALGETVRAVPGQRFEGMAVALHGRLVRGSERVERLARTLEQALERLETAFQEAAAELREEILPFSLTTTSLAVDALGHELPNQFAVTFPTASGRIPWNTACGPVALSIALSRVRGRITPAQEVADRLVQEVWKDQPDKRPSPGAKQARAMTDSWDLINTAGLYGVQGKMVSFDLAGEGDPSEKAWNDLQRLTRQPGAVMVLVTAKGTTSYSFLLVGEASLDG